LTQGGVLSGQYSWYLGPTLDVARQASSMLICVMMSGQVSKDGISNSLPGGFARGNGVMLADQARWNARAIELLHKRGDVKLPILYNWGFRVMTDDPQAAYSLPRPDGSCPSCDTIRSVIEP
jgi:hypothetical protein